MGRKQIEYRDPATLMARQALDFRYSVKSHMEKEDDE